MLIDDSYAKYIQFRTLHQRFLPMIDCLKWVVKEMISAVCVRMKLTAIHICCFTVKNLKKSGQT